MPVVYISTRGMMRAFESLGLGADRLCTYCIGGGHPFAGCESLEPAAENQLDLLSAPEPAPPSRATPGAG